MNLKKIHDCVCLSLFCCLGISGVQLFPLPFAKIGDLLHGTGTSRHLIHHRTHAWEERHERSQETTGAGHDDDLRLITPETLQNRLSHGLR